MGALDEKVFSMTAGLDLAALDAIDVHVHVESDQQGRRSLDDELLAASASYFKASQDRTPTVEQVAGHYAEVRPKILKHNAARLLRLTATV